MQISIPHPVNVISRGAPLKSATSITDKSSTKDARESTPPAAALVKRFDFERMTLGEFSDAVSELIKSGQISADEATDLEVTFPFPFGMSSEEEWRAMPANISYDWLTEVIGFTRPSGRHEEADRHERVFNLLKRLDGTGWKVDTQA